MVRIWEVSGGGFEGIAKGDLGCGRREGDGRVHDILCVDDFVMLELIGRRMGGYITSGNRWWCNVEIIPIDNVMLPPVHLRINLARNIPVRILHISVFWRVPRSLIGIILARGIGGENNL